MKKALVPIAVIAFLFLAYYWRTFHYAYFPPRDVATMFARACAFDDSQRIGFRVKGGPHQLSSCPQAVLIDTTNLTDARAVLARGRPFLLESAVVCTYRAPVAIPRPIRCDSYTDGP